MIRELRFAAPLVYSKRGESAAAVNSRRLRDRLKRVDVGLYDRIARYVLKCREEGHFADFFAPDAHVAGRRAVGSCSANSVIAVP